MYIVESLLLDERHMRLQSGLSQPEFDKLFLFHKLGVGTIVDHIRPENRSRQWTIDLFRINVLYFAIENKLVPLSPEVDGGFLAQQDEGKDIAVLEHQQVSTVSHHPPFPGK